MKDSITPRDVVDLLNQAVALDRAAVQTIFSNRVPTTSTMMMHPTIQCGQLGTVGALGLINGMFGIDDDGLGPILMHEDDDGSLSGFYLVAEQPNRENLIQSCPPTNQRRGEPQ